MPPNASPTNPPDHASRSVLVTGANGFIGRHVSRALLDLGYNVVGVGIEPNLVAPHGGLRYRQVDLTQPDAVARLFEQERFGAVLHLAALVHATPGKHSWPDYARINYRASERLFRLAYEHGVASIAFASTVEVYGAICSDQPVTEDVPCRPESDYAKSKLLAEEALAAEAAHSHADHAILRFAPVYASDFRLNLDKRLYLLTPTLGYQIGNGEYRLGLCSVRNIAHFLVRWFEAKSPRAGVFNLADNDAYTLGQLLSLEQRHGRARLVLRLPYLPCLFTLATLEVGMTVFGRAPGMMNVHNFRKLLRSSVWDNTRAKSIAGDLPWTVETSLYAAPPQP
jgi:UDP-glucose 4-epimerase